MQSELNHKKQGVFTRVELAIGMIIIGLLIGGILKGQELVANSQTTATIGQIKGLDAAIATFRDKYSQMPGDMRDPDTRLRNCTAAPCDEDGNGNGRIDVPALGNAPNASQEGAVAMVHLAAADLISGVAIDDATVSFGVMLPEAKVGGGFWLGYTPNGSATGGVTGMRAGHYLVFNGLSDANIGGTNGGLTATQAAQIDRKLDDGNPESGSVRSTGTDCIDTATDQYNEAIESSSCGMYIRVQG